MPKQKTTTGKHWVACARDKIRSRLSSAFPELEIFVRQKGCWPIFDVWVGTFCLNVEVLGMSCALLIADARASNCNGQASSWHIPPQLINVMLPYRFELPELVAIFESLVASDFEIALGKIDVANSQNQ